MVRKLTKKGLLRKQKEDWMNAVRERDNYTCQICLKDCGKHSHSHHILPKQLAEFRYDINNGITLCFNHHKVGAYSPHQNALWFSIWLKKNKPEQYTYLVMRLLEINQHNIKTG